MREPKAIDPGDVLDERHLRELHEESAIALDVIAERGYRTVTSAAELRALGFAPFQARAPALLIPLHGVDGTNGRYVIKPDHPRIERRPGKPDRPIKYEFPSGQHHMLDVPPRCLAALDDPGVALLFSEGWKKTDSPAGLGYCCVTVGGTAAWYRNPRHGGFETIEVLPDWKQILLTLDGRICYLVFDSDAWRNADVARELRRMANFLARRGALVYVVHLPDEPNGQKNGMDDYVARHGAEAFAELVENAEAWGSAGMARKQAAEIQELKAERSAIFGVLRNERLNPRDRIVAVAAVCDLYATLSHGAQSPAPIMIGTLDDGTDQHRRFGLAERVGLSKNTVQRSLKIVCGTGSPLSKTTVRTVTEQGCWRSAIPLEPLVDGGKLGALIAFVRFDPIEPRRHGGYHPRCPDHPNANFVRRETLLHFDCGCVVSEPAALEYQDGASEDVVGPPRPFT